MDLYIAAGGAFIVSYYLFKKRHERNNYEITRTIGDTVKLLDEMAIKLGKEDYTDYLISTRGPENTKFFNEHLFGVLDTVKKKG